MDGFLKPFLPICSVDVWLSRNAHFYQHLLKKSSAWGRPNAFHVPTFFRQRNPTKGATEWRIAWEWPLLAHSRCWCWPGLWRTPRGCWRKLIWLVFLVRDKYGHGMAFPSPAKLTYCWKTCRHATTGVGGVFSGLNQNPWARKLARWWVADPWGVL